MAGPPYSDEQIEAAVQALTEPQRLEAAQRVVAAQAPQLQRILNEALTAANWFGSAQEEQLLKVAGVADPDERIRTMKTLLVEESRIAMLVGVAVGLALADELQRKD